MAILVVDVLEVIDVHHHQCDGLAHAHGASHIAVQRGNQRTPVGHPGERIQRGHHAVVFVSPVARHENKTH
ncbi:hypothetical protein D3C72_2476570 [compost metagenome]